MQNPSYRYFYLQKHNTADILKKYIPTLDKNDLNNYMRIIGEHLYEFEIIDGTDSWKVLRTYQEIIRYLEIRSNTYKYIRDFDKLRKIENVEMFGEEKFQIGAPTQHENIATVTDSMVSFFQIYCVNIRKTTSLLMFKKGRALTLANKCAQFCCLGGEWSTRRIVITKEGVIQMADNGEVSDFLKFDTYFTVQSGSSETGHQFGISLNTAQRRMDLKARNAAQFITFLFYITKAKEQIAQKIGYQGSIPRSVENCIDYIIDAKAYFEQVAYQIENAKRDIMICGWWLSPEVYLIRPVHGKDPDRWRLDKLLKRKAESGVKIYILVFNAPSLIANNPQHTQSALVSQHPNIQVQMHPHNLIPHLWCHHEKAVIIDQKVAYMGGLDLCFGRYDDVDHPVDQNGRDMYPGIDYNNVRVKDFVQVQNFQDDIQDRGLPRMPWHDVAFKVRGKIVGEVSNHFIQYWNFTLIEKSVAPLLAKKLGHINQTKTLRENLETQMIDQSGRDLSNKQTDQLVGAILQMATEKQQKKFNEYIQNKEKLPRVHKAFRQEIKKKKFDLNAGIGQSSLVLSIESLGLVKKNNKIKQEGEQNDKEVFRDELQLLRSASEWSIGLSEGKIQRSIQNAYLSTIKNAKKYIYIENQFFVSAPGEKEGFVKNQIANALYDRIKKAIQNKQNFKVVVVMPLVPGVGGQLNQNMCINLKLYMYWQFHSISQSQDALLPRIAKLTNHPENYIEFYSVRKHGVLEGRPVTEGIYIHTKLMIVDDNYVICGSANLNDRSQEGNRDSELNVILLNGQKINTIIDEKPCTVNKKGRDLRVKLYMEHFGITEKQAEDPLNPKTIQLTRQIAKQNTQTYREIFGCLPDDNVKKLADCRKFQKPEAQMRELYQSHHKKIHGNAVQFPTEFLAEERLKFLKADLWIQNMWT